MNGDTAVGLLAWLSVGAGYAWLVWKLGRLGREPPGSDPARRSSPELEIVSGHHRLFAAEDYARADRAASRHPPRRQLGM